MRNGAGVAGCYDWPVAKRTHLIQMLLFLIGVGAERPLCVPTRMLRCAQVVQYQAPMSRAVCSERASEKRHRAIPKLVPGVCCGDAEVQVEVRFRRGPPPGRQVLQAGGMELS